MAKRRNSPALFELLRDSTGGARESGVGMSASHGAPAVAVAPAPAKPQTPAPEPVETTPTREAKPLSTEPVMEITSPRFVAEPVRVRPGLPEMPDLSGLEPEPPVKRGDDGRVAFSLTPAQLAGAAGAAMILLVIAITIAYSLGGAASKQELQPILGEQASQALGSSEQTPVREPVVREPATRGTAAADDSASRGPVPSADMALVPESAEQPPVVEDEDVAQAAAETDEAEAPSQPANVDTREPGLNYMYTSVTFDREEALKAQQFLFDNGIDSIVEEGTRRSDGRTVYRLWTLLGIPGAGFNQSREKFDHESAIFDLGNEWLTEHGGRLDFSRPGQIGWQKFGD